MSSSSIAERVLDAFPSGSYGLMALLRLLDIVETVKVPTAAVECRSMPLLLINPKFVEEHAATPERLLMLVMHELHHVLLGHTKLFPRLTPADNLIFDAVINALLCRMFPKPEHTSFFTAFYRDDRFPECLLRPPAQWRPSLPAPIPPALEAEGMRSVRPVYRALYSETGASYHELYNVLKSMVPPEGGVQLIGNHVYDKTDGLPAGETETELEGLVFDMVRTIVEHWPQPPDPVQGRSWDELLRFERVRPRPSNRGILRSLIRKVAGNRGVNLAKGYGVSAVTSATPILTGDRRSVVLRALKTPQLLYRTELTARARERCDRVHVYVDVSGSIGNLKGALYGAVLDCLDVVHPIVHLFSTKVHDISFAGLRTGECRTTNGTSIECVATHIRSCRVRRAVLLTDGYVGRPGAIAAKTLGGSRLGVALTPGGTRKDLEQFIRFWAELNGRN
jgi:hypothetical protein